MKTLDEKNKGRRIKEKELAEENLKDAELAPNRLRFESLEESIYASRKNHIKRNEKKKEIFDDTIEPNVIKIRKINVGPGLACFRENHDLGKITGYYLETLFCIILRERKFTREQVAELFDIKLSQATQILKGKTDGWNTSFYPQPISDRFEKLGYTLAKEI